MADVQHTASLGFEVTGLPDGDVSWAIELPILGKCPNAGTRGKWGAAIATDIQVAAPNTGDALSYTLIVPNPANASQLTLKGAAQGNTGFVVSSVLPILLSMGASGNVVWMGSSTPSVAYESCCF